MTEYQVILNSRESIEFKLANDIGGSLRIFIGIRRADLRNR